MDNEERKTTYVVGRVTITTGVRCASPCHSLDAIAPEVHYASLSFSPSSPLSFSPPRAAGGDLDCVRLLLGWPPWRGTP